MKNRLALTLLLVSYCFMTMPAMSAQQISFGSGKAAISLPDSYKATVNGDDLIAYFGDKQDNQLEITLLATLPKSADQPNLAVLFVRAQAAKRKLKLADSETRAALVEPAPDEPDNGKVYRVAHWQVGQSNCVFTVTISAPIPLTPEITALLTEPLNAVTRELMCRTK